ncbi:hypothetical protein EIP91_010427 [Steccherinum ochraceum]|uniref:Protein kinase domain-containing protein n=1 Tax=Steccherinum ochraceum TaxID=92696 RepID=A0A4R0R373_9APHY|nr:hypothetical protein EIP91_010427 [Steccherinum ochraceum]
MDARYLLPLQGDVVSSVLDVVIAAGRMSLALEVPDSSRWYQASKKMPISMKDRVLSAYQKIHARGVLHGSVSLRNILISPDNRITIIDFSRARSVLPNRVVEYASTKSFEREMEEVRKKLGYHERLSVNSEQIPSALHDHMETFILPNVDGNGQPVVHSTHEARVSTAKTKQAAVKDNKRPPIEDIVPLPFSKPMRHDPSRPLRPDMPPPPPIPNRMLQRSRTMDAAKIRKMYSDREKNMREQKKNEALKALAILGDIPPPLNPPASARPTASLPPRLRRIATASVNGRARQSVFPTNLSDLIPPQPVQPSRGVQVTQSRGVDIRSGHATAAQAFAFTTVAPVAPKASIDQKAASLSTTHRITPPSSTLAQPSGKPSAVRPVAAPRVNVQEQNAPNRPATNVPQLKSALKQNGKKRRIVDDNTIEKILEQRKRRRIMYDDGMEPIRPRRVHFEDEIQDYVREHGLDRAEYPAPAGYHVEPKQPRVARTPPRCFRPHCTGEHIHAPREMTDDEEAMEVEAMLQPDVSQRETTAQRSGWLVSLMTLSRR